MNKVFVFCIGGTGIRVMKSIIMLMAGGMKTNGYQVVPIIIDPHVDLAEKGTVNDLIGRYKVIYDKSINNGNSILNPLEGFFNSEIKTVKDLNNRQNSTDGLRGFKGSFRTYIGQAALGSNDVNNYLVNTLFSTKNLDNSLSVGFKGNPNVGTVVISDMIKNSDEFQSFVSHCVQGDRVFIISSIFGGTGASGYPVLEKLIRGDENHPPVQGATMGAVTVLPYYSLENPDTSGSDIASENFYTKTKAALTYYKDTIKSDYLYYVGEGVCDRVSYENDETKQDDKAHFIELVAASALFDFLNREKPTATQYMTRAIQDDQDSMNLHSLGNGYEDIVKSVADFKLLQQIFIEGLPKEKHFPLSKNRGMNDSFFQNDSAFQALKDFSKIYGQWYHDLANNKRAFAPICDNNDPKNMSGWIIGKALRAKDDSYYLLEMIKESNRCKEKHNNKFRFFLQFAHRAIDYFTH